MPGIYKEVFDYLGLSLEKDLPSKPLETIYKMHFPDGVKLDFTTNNHKMEQQLDKLEPGSYQQAQRFIRKGYELYQLAYSKLLGRNFTNWTQFINLSNVALLIRIKTYMSHQRYVRQFFKDPHLRVAFSFQNIYVGQNPLTAPALFAMLPAAELTEGSLFPEGGMNGIVEVLLKTAVELGVEIQYNKPVKQIQTQKNRATGLLLEDDSVVEGDLIVANADLPYVYKKLLNESVTSAVLERKKYSCSAIAFHWGLNKKYHGLGHHGVFFSSNYETNLHGIFQENALGDEPSFYTHAPVETDPSAAPEGCDTLTVLVPCGHLDARNEKDWQFYKQQARLSVIKRLQKEGYTDIDEHITFELNSLPKTWEQSFNVAKGSIFGSINHSIFQMGYFRPHNRHRKLKNVFFAGGSTHPGNGVPLVLLSAKLTTERILNDFQ